MASHLYRRAGFGADGVTLDRALSEGPHKTVEALLSPDGASSETDLASAENERAAARSGDAQAWTAWWLRRLTLTRDPLGERLTLFWHGHFAIGAAATGNLLLYHQHLQRLRSGARGTFSALLETLFEDPAMFVALRGEQNRRTAPNLAFARRWLESFTVGLGVAHPDDIRALARAFTGWFVYGGQLRFISREHDGEEMTLFNQTGAFDRQDLAALLANHPAAAQRLAQALFRWFVSEVAVPPPALLAPIAEALRRNRPSQELAGTILRSNLFFSHHAVHQKVKSPVELLVGLAKALERTPPPLTLAQDASALGQRLDEPPTVAGWAGGVAWINSITIAHRIRCCQALVEGADGYGQGADPGQIARLHGRRQPGEFASFWSSLLLGQDELGQPLQTNQVPVTGVPIDPIHGQRLLIGLISQPRFQLA